MDLKSGFTMIASISPLHLQPVNWRKSSSQDNGFACVAWCERQLVTGCVASRRPLTLHEQQHNYILRTGVRQPTHTRVDTHIGISPIEQPARSCSARLASSSLISNVSDRTEAALLCRRQYQIVANEVCDGLVVSLSVKRRR